MGLDGGGTKTDCVLVDEAGRVLGRGRGGASNPSRIGFDAARIGILAAARGALHEAGKQIEEVTDVCAGLAGVGRSENADRMQKELKEIFAGAKVHVCTDLDLALAGAKTGPAIVLVAGTGSGAIGRDGNGRVARSGGHGPATSDEGSAFAIGKRAVANAGVDPGLARRILDGLGMQGFDEVLAKAAEDADGVYPRVFPIIAVAADEGNATARDLLKDAAKNLAKLVSEVEKDLELSGAAYFLGKIGGTIGRSRIFDEALNEELRRVAPHTRAEHLSARPAEIAARLALQR